MWKDKREKYDHTDTVTKQLNIVDETSLMYEQPWKKSYLHCKEFTISWNIESRNCITNYLFCTNSLPRVSVPNYYFSIVTCICSSNQWISLIIRIRKRKKIAKVFGILPCIAVMYKSWVLSTCRLNLQKPKTSPWTMQKSVIMLTLSNKLY